MARRMAERVFVYHPNVVKSFWHYSAHNILKSNDDDGGGNDDDDGDEVGQLK